MVTHLIRLNQPATQDLFGAIVGVSQPIVSELLTRAILTRDATLGEWVQAYCANLREQAAGRAGSGDLKLVGERARLASEQADRVAMENAKTRRELAPVAVLERALARVGRQIAGILEALPVQLRRRSTSLSAEDQAMIEEEIARARNLAANMELTLDDSDGDDGDPSGDPLRAETA